MLEVFKHLGAFEQGFGGDTAPVEADAAEAFALDDGGVEAELGGADGSYIAAGAAADNDEVEVHGRRNRLMMLDGEYGG